MVQHTELTRYAFDLLSKAAERAGVVIRCTEALRTPERQAELYAQGRTTPGPIVTNARPGQSAHETGRAFDIAPAGTDPDSAAYNAGLARVGAIWQSVGGIWGGGYRTLSDPEHFEIPA